MPPLAHEVPDVLYRLTRIPPDAAEQTRRVDTRQCHPNDGYGGFDINVWRDFRRPGSSAVVRSEKFHTTYIPSDTVICESEKRTTPPSEDGGD